MTRWRQFVRADLLSGLPLESQAALVHYGIRTVIDLRTTAESLVAPDDFTGSSDIKYHHYNLLGDAELPSYAVNLGTPSGLAEHYSWILDNRQSQIRDTLSTLASPESLPAVFHCLGGTDRTGIIAALLLSIAGVPEDTIAEDYSLSAQGLVDRFLAEGVPEWMPPEDLVSGRALETLAPADVVLMTLQRLDARYGGVEAYARTIGLTTEQIKRLRDVLVGER